jgi:phosphoribosylglycinamide formyltransferase-1
MYKVGFMASGGGTNFKAILNRIADGSLPGVSVAFLISNNSKCGAFEIAKVSGVCVYHLSSVTHPNDVALAKAIVSVCIDHQIDLLVLAGYMKKIPDLVLNQLPNRVINIHPALLPSFGGPGHWGMHVHEALVDAGARVSGPTVHFVDSIYDHGRIIAQRAVAVASQDTPEDVAKKVQAVEYDLYWRVVKAFSEGAVRIQGGRILCDVD